MYDNICSLPLSSELTSQAVHPKLPIVAVGLAAGHVQTFRLPSLVSETNGTAENDDRSEADSGFGTVDTEWRTRRHKGCRAVEWSVDGESLFSAGLERIVKAADAETGQVVAKWTLPCIPNSPRSTRYEPYQLRALAPQTLILTVDEGELFVYDLRESIPKSAKPAQQYKPHEDCVNSITPLKPSASSTSGFAKQWVTTGSETLTVTDLRKGIISKSTGQDDWLMSSAYVDTAGKGNDGDMIAAGGSGGMLMLWQRGQWTQQTDRINVDKSDKGESIDALTVLPRDGGAPEVVAGLGDGRLKIMNLKSKSMAWNLRHDDEEGVTALGVDIEGRLISGGGSVVKVWRKSEQIPHEMAYFRTKRQLEEGSDSDGDAGPENDDSSEEEELATSKKRKKRKRNKGKKKSKEQPRASFAGLD